MYTDAHGQKWWKGNLHTHTTLSDGRRTPQQVLRLYADFGYDFLALTDHWVHGPGGCEQGLLVLPGCEYNVGGNRGANGIYHILAIGCHTAPDITRQSTPQAMIDAIHAAGGLAGLAHPAWSLNSPEQIAALRGVDFTEIFNSISDLPYNARPYSGLVLDIAAAHGHPLPLAATDDAHFYGTADICRSFCYVQADSCTPDALLAALAAGRFYASQGPTLALQKQGRCLTVRCSPVEQIVYFTDCAWHPHRAEVGHDLTEGHFEAGADDSWVRVEVRDAAGRYAWSQYVTL